MREDFALIPVIDLKDGGVVHARAGKRADYRPLETPFGLADDPVAIARALLAVTDSPILYVADLDAIAGTGHQQRLGKWRAGDGPQRREAGVLGRSAIAELAGWDERGKTSSPTSAWRL